MKCSRDLSKKKYIKTMNSKITRNLQLLTIEPKKTKMKTKQTIRTGIESQIWRAHGGLSVGSRRGRVGEKCTGNKKYNW